MSPQARRATRGASHRWPFVFPGGLILASDLRNGEDLRPPLRRAAGLGVLSGLVLMLALPAEAGLIKVGAPAFSADELALWSGRRVERISHRGNRVTRDYVIAREIRTRVGDPLDLRRLARDLLRLDNIAVFADIRVEAEAAGEDGVALSFVFKESPSYFPLLAFTFTEENGFSVGPGLSALNLTGRAIGLSGRAYFGGTTQYWLNFNWPWAYGTDHNSVALLAAHRERADVLRGFQETSDEITPRLGRYLGEQGRLNVSATYLRMRSDEGGITLDPDNEDDLVRLGLSLGWDTRDSWGNPRRGVKGELEVLRTGGPLGGDGDFWSVNVDLRRWLATGPRQRLLLSGLLSLQTGTLGEDVPVYLDYYMGGANSIRGYEVTELGTPFSGKNQLLGTAEYSFSLVPPRRWDLWFIALRLGVDLSVFADAGIAWNEAREFGWKRSRAGLGGGFRLLVPGSEMLRLDLGWSPQGGLQFHFATGSKPAAQRNRLR